MFIDADVVLRRGAVSCVVRVSMLGQVQCRAVRGWRALAIDQCLDMCARVEGCLLDGEWERGRRVDDGGRRLYSAAAQYKRAWARRNVEVARENSRVQWKKAEVVMRADYAECGALYRSIYPGVGVPGFDTWRRQFRKAWLADRLVCLGAMHRWKLSAGSFEHTEKTYGVSGS